MRWPRGMSHSGDEIIPCPLCGCKYTPGGGMASHLKSCKREIAKGTKRVRGITWSYSEALKRWVAIPL